MHSKSLALNILSTLLTIHYSCSPPQLLNNIRGVLSFYTRVLYYFDMLSFLFIIYVHETSPSLYVFMNMLRFPLFLFLLIVTVSIFKHFSLCENIYYLIK